MKKKPIKCYYSSDFVTLKILSVVNNTEFVAILIRFLGTSALPFCLRWANTACALWRMFNTGKAKGQRSPAISRERRELRCARLYGYPCMLNMCHSAHVVLAQRKQNGNAPVTKNRMSITTNSVLLTISDSIFKVFTVKKQIRMCNYKIFYGNYFDIHFQYRQKVYIIGKSQYGDIFSMAIPAISADWNIVKKRYTEISTELNTHTHTHTHTQCFMLTCLKPKCSLVNYSGKKKL